MELSMQPRIFRRLRHMLPLASSARLRRTASLHLEELELRLAPADWKFTFTNATGDGKWSTTANWTRVWIATRKESLFDNSQKGFPSSIADVAVIPSSTANPKAATSVDDLAFITVAGLDIGRGS